VKVVTAAFNEHRGEADLVALRLKGDNTIAEVVCHTPIPSGGCQQSSDGLEPHAARSADPPPLVELVQESSCWVNLSLRSSTLQGFFLPGTMRFSMPRRAQK